MRIRMRRRALWLWAISGGLLLGALTLALAQAGGRLLVVNALSENLSVIDIAADKSLGSIPLGAHGYRVALSPDGHTAYVTATSEVTNAAQAGTRTAISSANLLIVDLIKSRVAGQIPLDISPLANVHVHPDGRTAFVVTAGPPGSRNLERGRVLFVDLPQRRVAQAVNIGLNPLDSVMTPDGRLLFTADWGSRSISVVDLANARLLDTIPLGMSAARTLAMRPDGEHVYAALETPFIAYNNIQANAFMAQTMNFTNSPGGGTTIADIEVGTRKITQFPVEDLKSVIAIAVAPDGKRLYAYGTATAQPLTIEQAPAQNNQARSQSKAVQPPAQQQQIAAPAETFVLLAIDPAKGRVVRRFGAYGYLSALAVSPDGKKLYLIGTPGDPAREAAVSRQVNDRVRSANFGNDARNSKAGPSLPESQDTMSGILDDLRNLPKTLTVLDAGTGRPLKSLPLGSLPQGYGVVGK